MRGDNTIERLVDAMSEFAANTRSDTLSVRVARVAHRLQNLGKPFEKPLNAKERQIIRPFAQHLGIQLPQAA